MHILDRDPCGGGADGVANTPDCLQDRGNFGSRRIVIDPCDLGRRIDLRRGHAGDRGERFLDRRWTMGTRHSTDAQLDALAGRRKL